MKVGLVGLTARIGFRVRPPQHLISPTGQATGRSGEETLARMRRRLIWILTVGAATLLVNALAVALGWYAVI